MDRFSYNGMISAEDLYYLLGANKNIRVLDASYSVAGGMQSPFDAFLGKRIPEAQFFDIDAIADREAALPHTVPDADFFAACVASLGVSNKDHVVIYDQSGAYMASSRAWWMFRLFGHENVYVLEGGLESWTRRGFRTVSGACDSPEPGHFEARLRSELIVSKTDLINNLETGAVTVIDARPAGRFDGLLPEPRTGMRAGHIPGSVNLPFGNLMDRDTRHLLDPQTLEATFSAMEIAEDAKIAVSCGSGVTACTVALALFKARGQDSAIYDGSWSEWGHESSGTPVELSA
ncbi:MAG: 3-mercaptopyruvate sulfurtransferase [Micavibrio aeruginosavorus]|uniref:3-mercaptopyruvate sulfurtransferase n=1 Tax=Micavibrio aeruginosavorus TaxID=349221 RepID=A0A2W5BIZ8_9BACT|nr:MAG: 3-mercaptopyruvate sulfurtransferase [Micavibrio aeruginosavorus]